MTVVARPLHILHLTAASDAGGISRYLLDLAAAMRRQGHEITFAGDRGVWHERFERQGFRWIDVPLKRGVAGFWKSVRTLRLFLREHPVDVLHAHYRRATLLGRRLQQRAGSPPLLYTLHLSHMPMGWGRRWLSDFGDVTHVPALAGKEWLLEQRLASEDRIAYVPHGVRPAEFPIVSDAARAAARASLRLGSQDVVAAYVGRLDYPKNVDWLQDVAEQSRARVANLKLLIAGDGPLEGGLRAAAAARHLTDRVVFLGEREPLPIYQAADVLLLPSLREGFSLATAEAMSVGVPVLRTRTSGTVEQIVEGVTGRSVEIDHDAFVRGAIEFLAEPVEKLREVGAAAAEHVRTNLTFDRQLERTLDLYKRLIPAATR